jgi:tRNA dimethylallyltransferase
MNFLKKLFQKKPNVIVIAGPTASGKSDLAVELAQICNGEIISADSRQVYIGMDIGSAKITREEMKGIPHHMLDVCDPTKVFNVSDYVAMAKKHIDAIHARKKIPIICGGTGFYIDSLIYQHGIPKVKPNPQLRERYASYTTQRLVDELNKKDPQRASTIDKNNRVRLIRALEIIQEQGSVPIIKKRYSKSPFRYLYIVITVDKKTLYKRIEKRVVSRLKTGMIDEVATLHASGVSWERLESFGLEYRYLAQYLQDKISLEDATQRIISQTKKYAKRQVTWFKKNPHTQWFNIEHNRDTLIRKVLSWIA